MVRFFTINYTTKFLSVKLHKLEKHEDRMKWWSDILPHSILCEIHDLDITESIFEEQQ